jgi:predicted DNA-binding protein with PD1-like motif
MRYIELREGRRFLIRLDGGDVLHSSVEAFASEHDIATARVTAIGGADNGSRIICGPKGDAMDSIVPVEVALEGIHEMHGIGTLVLDGSGRPVLHMHASFGRERSSLTGCVRPGVVTWLVMEVLIEELLGEGPERVADDSGFLLMEPAKAVGFK